MKSVFTFLIISMASVSAMAWPNLQDEASYDLLVLDGGNRSSGDVTVQIFNINAAADEVYFQNETTIDGRMRASYSKSSFSGMLLFQQTIATTMTDCVALGGQFEDVRTIYRVYRACKMQHNGTNTSGFIWIADVKFGWVKKDETDLSTGVRTISVYRYSN